MDKEKVIKINVSILEILTVLFIGLKLTGYITWSWFWVLSPVIIPGSIVILTLCYLVYKLKTLEAKRDEIVKKAEKEIDDAIDAYIQDIMDKHNDNETQH